MAKGDKNKVQNQVNTQTSAAQNTQNNLTNTITPQNQNFWNNYQGATQEAQGDYRNIMDQYRNFQASPAAQRYDFERVNYNRNPELNSAMQGYQDFANTGGFSEANIADMRARGISPIRAVYSNMMNEMTRQKNLAGGYSPNFNAAATKLRSGTSQQIADQVQNVNAELARMVQSGRLSGLEGLGRLSVQDLDMSQRAALANQNAGLQGAQLNATNIDPLRLAAIQGQANLYGTTPGMANMFGNQVLQSGNQLLNLGNQQQDIGRMGIQGQQAVAQTPSNFETGLGRVGQIANIASSVASPFLAPGASAVMGAVRPNVNSRLLGGQLTMAGM